MGETTMKTSSDDAINPAHYKSHPSGVECWQVAECFPYHIGVAIAYLWRCDLKGTPIVDIEKAINHLRREIERRKAKP